MLDNKSEPQRNKVAGYDFRTPTGKDNRYSFGINSPAFFSDTNPTFFNTYNERQIPWNYIRPIPDEHGEVSLSGQAIIKVIITFIFYIMFIGMFEPCVCVSTIFSIKVQSKLMFSATSSTHSKFLMPVLIEFLDTTLLLMLCATCRFGIKQLTKSSNKN